MTTRTQIVIASVLVLVAALAAFGYYQWERSQRERRQEEIAAGLVLEEEAPETDQVVQVELYVYRPHPEKPGEIRLESVSLPLPAIASEALSAQQLVNTVIRESSHLLPPQARVRQVYLLEDGTAVVDLSHATAAQLTGGVTAELGVLESFTRSLRRNLPRIERVRFLVEGEERPTLSGHVSILHPFM